MNRAFAKIEWQDLNTMSYCEAWALQADLRRRRISGEICDRMLLVEHPPVITLGRRDCGGDILTPESDLKSSGIEVIKTDRGGRATYHGPGQLVGYFVCALSELCMGVKDFVQSIEEICIRALSDFGIKCSRDSEHPGLWVGNNKIVAIGLNVSHGVTQHGFALNVDCDLAAYAHIVACGINDRGITSMASVLGRAPEMDEVKCSVIAHTGQVLRCDMVSYINSKFEIQNPNLFM